MEDAPSSPAPSADKPPQPVMDVVPPKPAEPPKPQAQDNPPKPENTQESTHQKPQKPAVAKPPKESSNGVGLAIFATIVIVIALAALFVYAYLRTNNVSLY